MHLAICDDHIADRKQMERLLGRESDRRIPTTGVLYVDSYGSEHSILSTPMIYDAIFMDMTEDGADAVRIARQLRQNGTRIPIVFCSGKVNYRACENLPDPVLFLDKPIQVAALSSMIDELLLLVSCREKKMEFRNTAETYYLQEQELIYALYQDEHHMLLHLTDNRTQIAEGSFLGFCDILADSDCYVALANKTVVNMAYIGEVSFLKVMLTDGTVLRLSLGEATALKKHLESYRHRIQQSPSA